MSSAREINLSTLFPPRVKDAARRIFAFSPDHWRAATCERVPYVKAYLVNVLQQINDWLMEKKLQKLVMVISAVGSKEVLERWVFDIEADASVDAKSEGKEKPEKEINQEISAIIRQITASVTFLPLLEEACTFDLLVYTNTDSSTPEAGCWVSHATTFSSPFNSVQSVRPSFEPELEPLSVLPQCVVADSAECE